MTLLLGQPTGLPRPSAPGCEGEAWPVPWMVEWYPGEEPNWTKFDIPRLRASHHGVLCQVCGLTLGHVIVLGKAYRWGTGRETSGTGMHPRCGLVAVSRCPHLSNFEPGEQVGWVYRGEGPGYECHDDDYPAENDALESAENLDVEGLRALARDDPWGAVPSSGPLTVGLARD